MDPWSLPEWAFLRGETWIAAMLASAAGGAGTRSEVQLFNPTGSGKILMIDYLTIIPSTAADEVDYGVGVVPLTTLSGAAVRRDRRTGTSAIQRRTDNTIAAVAVTPVGRVRGAANVAIPLPYPLGVTLPPGNGFTVRPVTDNVAVSASMLGRERSMLPGELPTP